MGCAARQRPLVTRDHANTSRGVLRVLNEPKENIPAFEKALHDVRGAHPAVGVRGCARGSPPPRVPLRRL